MDCKRFICKVCYAVGDCQAVIFGSDEPPELCLYSKHTIADWREFKG
jgi:hypothetical protein